MLRPGLSRVARRMVMDTRREALAAGRRAPGTSLLPAAMGVQRVPSALSRGGVAHMCSKAAGDKAAKEKAAEEEAGAEGEEATKDQKKEEVPPEEEPEPPLEPIGFGRGLAYLAALGIGLGSLYFIFDELMPSRMSANYLFGEAFDVVKANHDVRNRFGEPLKAFGRDGGGRREGRRNFIEHRDYVAPDGTKRLRIRFNVEGPFGHAFVFAEVADNMKQGEWVYLLVQDLQSGKTITIEDNRAMLAAMAGSQSDQERAALQALIKGGGQER